jgi:multicomponent Na+:H+ antiporter subunit F
MTEFLTAALGVILAMLALGLVRILRGPGEADRMMAAQLIGTGGIAALLLLGAVTGVPAAVDVALTVALLATSRRRADELCARHPDNHRCLGGCLLLSRGHRRTSSFP